LVKQQNPNNNSIESFSFYTGNSNYDELPWVEQMISRTSFTLNPCKLDASEVPELFNLVSFHEDEPFGGLPTLAYSKIFAQARQKGIKVLLDGQGMDEAWAGYDYYRSDTYATIQGLQSNPYRPQVMSCQLANLVEKEKYPQPFESRLQNLQYRDLFYTKIPRALRFNDRITMMHSTELREPFLDHRLVELAFAQPDQLKLKGQNGKALLRQWASDWIGNSLSLAPKRALQTHQREWLGHELQEWVNKQLAEFSSIINLVDGKQMNELYKHYLEGNETSSFHIWQLISLAQAIKNSNEA
jgi:asparagine synthase (glutamine-hydrolysing)